MQSIIPSARVPGFYNFTGGNLNRWVKARALVAAGTRNAIVLCTGDSTTAGQGSTGNGAASNAKSNSYPTKLAQLLTGASWSSVMGDNGTGAAGSNVGAFDTRCTLGGWTQAVATLSGSFLKSPTAAGTFSFTPLNTVDTFVLGYAIGPGNGTFSYNLNGGSNTNINTNASAAQGVVTISGTLGTNTINLAWVSGSNSYINQIYAYNSALKEISVFDCGACGSLITSVTVNTNPYSYRQNVTRLAPDLTIMMWGINDWNSATSLSSFLASLTTAFSDASASGDVIIMSGVPSNPTGNAAEVTQQAFSQLLRKFALDKRVPFIDIHNLSYGNYSVSNSIGWRYDSLHPNNAGYTKIANWVYQALQPGFVSV